MQRWRRGVLVLAWCLALVLCSAIGAGQSPFPLVKTYQLGPANYESKITGVTFCPADGRYLILTRQDYGGFQVLDTQNWNVVATLSEGFANWISFNAEWSLAALYAGVFDTATWDRVWGFGSSQGLLNSETWQPFSPDGTLLVCPGLPITLWDAATGTLRQKLYLPQARVPMALAYADNGAKILAAWNNEGRVEIASWETASGMLLPSIVTSVSGWFGGSWFGGAVFSPDASFLAVQTRNNISIVNAASGATVSSFSSAEEDDAIAGLVFVADGRLLASGVRSVVTLSAVPSGRQVATFRGDPLGFFAFGVSADGQRLAAGGGTGRVDVWDISAVLPYSCSGFSISKVDWKKGCVTIKNTASEQRDLLGWRITDGDKSFTFPASTPIAAGQTYIACSDVYNPGKSSRGLQIDGTDEQVALYSPDICGGMKESTKKQ